MNTCRLAYQSTGKSNLLRMHIDWLGNRLITYVISIQRIIFVTFHTKHSTWVDCSLCISMNDSICSYMTYVISSHDRWKLYWTCSKHQYSHLTTHVVILYNATTLTIFVSTQWYNNPGGFEAEHCRRWTIITRISSIEILWKYITVSIIFQSSKSSL